MEKFDALATGAVTEKSGLINAVATVKFDKKSVLLLLAVLSVNAAILSGLLMAFGFDFLATKIVEFFTQNLSKLFTQGYFIATVAACLIVEAFMVRKGKSSLLRLLKPSKSARTDIAMFVLHVTGIIAVVSAVMTFGASEWFPMVLRKLPSFDVLFFTDNAWVKFGIIYLILSVLDYWVHRLGHTWKWCWEGHKFHHAATEMTMLTAVRGHPLDGLVGLVVTAIPAAILGESGLAPVAVVVTLKIVHSALIHSNVNWNFGWLGTYVIASPRYHRIHHSTHEEHINKNYGGMIIIWDRIFGTYYDGDVDPVEFGFAGNTYNDRGVVHDLMDGARGVFSEMYIVIQRAASQCAAFNSMVPATPDHPGEEEVVPGK